MASSALSNYRRNVTPQTQQADPRQVRNAAGGYVFEVTDLQRLRRFLILGSEGTYYTSGTKLTEQNATVVSRMSETDHTLLVDTIVDVSLRGAAPRQSPTLFALALACSTDDSIKNAYALSKVVQVCRTATMLFEFLGYMQNFRSWGRPVRREVGKWYTDMDVDRLALQMTKYRKRQGWTHRDVLRKLHPNVGDERARADLLRWAVKGEMGDAVPRLVTGLAKASEAGADYVGLVNEYGLTWEMLPDEALANPKVWEALAPTMGLTALMRKLPTMTRRGVFDNRDMVSLVGKRLTDAEALRKARVHPMNALVAQRTYASGRSVDGKGTWMPLTSVTDILDESFYASFGAVEPSGRKTLLALDVSGSMAGSVIPKTCLSARDASAALAMAQLSVDPDSTVVGFSGGRHGYQSSRELIPGLVSLDLSRRRRLDDAVASVSNLPFGSTDASLPLEWAIKAGIEVETLVVYTDNETYGGQRHVHQALEAYRKDSGLATRMVVVGMTATECSIADPSDPLSLDIAGFDTSTPSVITSFSKGEF